MERTITWRQSLVRQFPYLMPKNALTGETPDTYDYSYVVGEYDLPEGWFELFLQMCEDIRKPLEEDNRLNEFRFLQVKEKYGSLRVYTTGASIEVHDIIDKYEFLSQQVCSVCGNPATVMTYGYICPYCSDHVRGSMDNVEDGELITIKTSFLKKTHGPNGTVETELDCSEEWNRYLKRIGYEDET